MFFLKGLLARFIVNGRLTVIDHDGRRYVFGSGANGPDVVIRFADARLARELFSNPELKAGEAYMDGRLTFEQGEIFDLLSLFSVNRSGLASHPFQQALRRVWRALKRVHQNNPIGKAARNARDHYDYPEAFYSLWLDESMNYTCAYFTHPDETLEDAQVNKMRHVAAKLKLEPGMTVADLGCGWGAMAIYLAKTCGARVTAVNVSPEQLAVARRRAEEAGVADRVTFIEQDLRLLQGQYDRVVTIGSMEHAGVNHFDDYFRNIMRLLKPGGFAVVHAIGRMSPPGTTGPFIRKYIFPGGYVPAMSEVFASAERTGVWVADCEILRLHYYWTIHHWRMRFMSKRGDVVAMMGERFARMWEFYLGAVELGFLHGSNMIYQLLIAKNRDDVPVIRDYIVDAERALLAASRP